MMGGSERLEWIPCDVPICKRQICISLFYYQFWILSSIPTALVPNELCAISSRFGFPIGVLRDRFSCFNLQSQAQSHETAISTRVVYICGRQMARPCSCTSSQSSIQLEFTCT